MFCMRPDPEIDRSKHDIDLLEHVFKGVRAETAHAGDRVQVTDFSIRPWIGGDVIAAVQVQVLDDTDEYNRRR